MKAIVYEEYGPPEVLRLKQVEKPTPAQDEVLVRIRATTATRADSHMRRADPFIARFFTGVLKPRNGVIPGSEFAGQIEAVGTDVRRFQAGDKVIAASGAGFGSHAEYICVAEDGALAHMPKGLTYEEAAAIIEGGLTALPFLRDHGKIESADRVLVNGASGAVGTAAVQLAKFYGAHVTGVCSTANLDLVRSIGADAVIDYTREDFTRSGRTYDIIFDAVGKSSFSRCKGALNKDGVFLFPAIGLAILFQTLWTSMIGSKRAVFAATGLRQAADRAKDLAFLAELAEAGKMKPVIDRTYPLEAAVEAHTYVETGHKKGAVVISITDG